MKYLPNALLVLLSLGAVPLGFLFRDLSKTELSTAAFFIQKISPLMFPGIFPSPNDIENDLKQWRSFFTKVSAKPKVFFSDQVLDVNIKSRYGNEVRARIYKPKVENNEYLPVVLWLHGGGWIVGSVDNDDFIADTLGNITKALVVSVDYRLAPENKFPAAVQDAVASLEWVYHSIESYGGDKRRIYMAGESAGANIAAAVTALAVDDNSPHKPITDGTTNIQGLIIAYPPLEYGVSRQSHFLYRRSFAAVTLEQLHWFWYLYLKDQRKDSQDYRACPLVASDDILKKFPKTMIILAKHDVLLDEGIEFGDRLKAAGVDVTTIVHTDKLHGFFLKPDGGSETCPKTVEMNNRIASMVI